jgi:hypothetical protein
MPVSVVLYQVDLRYFWGLSYVVLFVQLPVLPIFLSWFCCLGIGDVLLFLSADCCPCLYLYGSGWFISLWYPM